LKRASWLRPTRANDRIYLIRRRTGSGVVILSSETVVAARAQVGICGHTLRWNLDSLLLFWVDSSGSDI
jgi:acyl dehydratase